MTIGKMFIYVGLAIAATVILFASQFVLHKKLKWWIALIGFIVKLCLSALFGALAIAITSPLGWNYSFISVSLYIAFFGDALADFIGMIVVLARKKPMHVWLRGGVGLVLTLAFLTFGLINMQTVTSKEHTYYSEKLDHEYKGVFVSDLHYGSAQMPETVEKYLKKIKAENPDFFLLGGDVTDEYTTKEEMEKIYEMIGSLGIPTYYIHGNHDRQPRADKWAKGRTYTDEELIETIEKNGITILKDNYVYFADDLILMGREDYSAGDERKKAEELPARPSNVYVINVDHSPYQTEDIVNTKADLQLSGHTHDGQYFPLGVGYSLFVKHIFGAFTVGETDLYVSPGICGWHDPVRTEQRCTYEIIKLCPKKA